MITGMGRVSAPMVTGDNSEEQYVKLELGVFVDIRDLQRAVVVVGYPR